MNYSYIFTLCFDLLFSNLVVLNLVVLVWRIIWDTQDQYLQHGLSNRLLNAFISILGSVIIYILVKIRQVRHANKEARSRQQQQDEESSPVDKTTSSSSNNIHHQPSMSKIDLKVFILIFGFASINFWRGVWNFTTDYTYNSGTGIVMIGIVSVVALLKMKRYCSNSTVPFYYSKDSSDSAYRINPDSIQNRVCCKIELELRIQPNKWSYFIHFVNEFAADFFTIQVWRSLWNGYDIWVYPDDQLKSAYTSMWHGLACYLPLHFFNKQINQFVANNYEFIRLDKKPVEKSDTLIESTSSETSTTSTNTTTASYCTTLSHKIKTYAVLYFVLTVSGFGTINLWRAIWMFQLIYMYPPVFESEAVNMNVLNLAYICMGTMILWSLDLSSSLLSRASSKDNYYVGESNCIITEGNFTLFFLSKMNGSDELKMRMKTVASKLFRRQIKNSSTTHKETTPHMRSIYKQCEGESSKLTDALPNSLV